MNYNRRDIFQLSVKSPARTRNDVFAEVVNALPTDPSLTNTGGLIHTNNLNDHTFLYDTFNHLYRINQKYVWNRRKRL